MLCLYSVVCRAFNGFLSYFTGVSDHLQINGSGKRKFYGSIWSHDHTFYCASMTHRAQKTYFCCLMSLTLLIVLLQVILKLSLRVALFIYGSVCMACALLSCFLPIETKGRELKVRIIIATFHVICFLTH